MPVYEYRCVQCTKEFEYEHRMSEKRTECLECGGSLERLISRTSFAFKGGGWYKDLYASPKPGAPSEGGSSGSGGSGGSGGSSTASTPASPAAGSSSTGGASTGGAAPSSSSPASGGSSGGSSSGTSGASAAS